MKLPPSNVEDSEMRRLLVVDDEEIVLVALRETLLRAGYEVVAARDAAEALVALREKAFAVIITDQQMPRMTGLEFLAQAKVLRPDATRILITAVLNLGTVIEAINYGEIYRFIMKPWLREDFLGAVSSGVARYRLLAGNMRLRLRAEQDERRRQALQGQLDEARCRVETERARTRGLAEKMLSRFDAELGRRTRRVVEVCRVMARASSLEEAERLALEDAGWFHDLGWVGMPGKLLQASRKSPDSLNAREREAFEGHPRRSAEIASELGLGALVQTAIESHHERHDGSGYPSRLSGDSIPWLGRLLAVAVAYAEDGAGSGEGLGRIREGAGSAFDPAAVECLERSLYGNGSK